MKKGTISIEVGKPIKIIEFNELSTDTKESSISKSIGVTLKEYQKNIQLLIQGKYFNQRHLIPEYLLKPCNIFVFICNDGIFVRYDSANNDENKVRTSLTEKDLCDLAPIMSDFVIHFPKELTNYSPQHHGPQIEMIKVDSNDLESTPEQILKFPFEIYVKIEFSEGMSVPKPPNRPIPFLSTTNEIIFNLEGEIIPTRVASKEVSKEEQFITQSKITLPVGWLAIEVYPLLSEEYWKPEYTSLWAELDILTILSQKNAIAIELNKFDSRMQTRNYYSRLLNEFESLLNGLEEPVHQFLKQHPELLCSTHEKCWSKVKFGNTISDFVFREVFNDYQLVEIEAPIRELFRNDGQQRQELTHAINQVTDWVQYIQDNKLKVEHELELIGISTNPRTLVVIGRSASLTLENRRKLETLQAQQNKLRIITYDDVLSNAYQSLSRLFGSMDIQTDNAEIFIRDKQ